jgi:hypothetical protein
LTTRYRESDLLSESRVERGGSEGDFYPGVGDLLLEAETNGRLVMMGFLSLDWKNHGLEIDQ